MYKPSKSTIGIEAQKAFSMIEKQIAYFENMIPASILKEKVYSLRSIYIAEPFSSMNTVIFSDFHHRSEYHTHDSYIKVKHACTYLRGLCDIFCNMLNDYTKIIKNLEFIVDAFGDSLMIPKFNR